MQAVDLLGREPAARSLRPEERLVALLAVLVLVGGVLAAGRTPAAVPAALSVAVVGGGLLAGPGPAVRGEVVVALRNPVDRPVRLGVLSLRAPGLRVTAVRPAFGRPLEGREQREYVLAYEVSSCAGLVLPVVLRLSYLPGADAPARSAGLELDEDAFAPCPPGSTRQARPSLAVSGLGASVERSGAGVEGVLRLEVRNGGEALQLLQVFAEAPGVEFVVVGRPNGVTLVTEERTEVRLGFRVPDCAALGRGGRLLLDARFRGSPVQVEVAAGLDGAAAGRQAALDPVLLSCGGG